MFLAQCVEYRHGSCVADFSPCIQLTTQLAKPALLVKAALVTTSQATDRSATATAAEGDDVKTDALRVASSHAVDEDSQEAMLMSLSEQTLRLMQAIVFAHEQVKLHFSFFPLVYCFIR